MKIQIESRASIKERSLKPFAPNTALITITDNDREFVTLKNKPDYLLAIKFCDVAMDEVVFELNIGRELTEDEKLKICEKYHMFSDKQAEQVAKFIKSILGKADTLICQCEYGQSRSAGMAAAVKQFLTFDGIVIFADDEYYPDKVVYRKVLSALERGGHENS